jgi:hypothetical protein
MVWSGGSVNRRWHRGRQRDGTEGDEIRRILAEFRQQHGWEPGMEWNAYLGMYEYPQPGSDTDAPTP